MDHIDTMIIVGFLAYLASVLHDLRKEVRALREKLPK
jgi:hypothetical protein